jgi:hypothetical protein
MLAKLTRFNFGLTLKFALLVFRMCTVRSTRTPSDFADLASRLIFWSLDEVRGVHHTDSLACREQQAAIPQAHPMSPSDAETYLFRILHVILVFFSPRRPQKTRCPSKPT